MGHEQELRTQLKRLHRTIRRLVARSREFGPLRKLLRTQQVQLAIYVIPVGGGAAGRQELRCELTEDDRHFLKQAGITFQ